jgi:hypothetical protein
MFREYSLANNVALRLLDLSTCTDLTSIGSFAFHRSVVAEIRLPSGVSKVADYAFLNCSALIRVHLGQTQIRALPNCCFCRCVALETVTLPACLEVVGRSAFSGCSRLGRIDLGGTKVRALAPYCFDGCVALSVVVLPPNLESIGLQAFYNCTALAHLRFPATLRKIGSYALGCSGLIEADFGQCLTLFEMGIEPFVGCSALRRVRLGSVVPFTFAAFKNCPALEIVSVPIGAVVPVGLPDHFRVEFWYHTSGGGSFDVI